VFDLKPRVQVPASESIPAAAAMPGRSASDASAAAVRRSAPGVAARLAIEEMGDAGARALVAADAEGALFARSGAVLLAAFDRYRELATRGAPSEAFRVALRERLGIELPGWTADPEGEGQQL
jgi:hypothetical protein